MTRRSVRFRYPKLCKECTKKHLGIARAAIPGGVLCEYCESDRVKARVAQALARNNENSAVHIDSAGNVTLKAEAPK